jgi:hypothetical protein
MDTRTTVAHPFSLSDRLPRMAWRGLWLMTRYSLQIWLHAPMSTGASPSARDAWSERALRSLDP